MAETTHKEEYTYQVGKITFIVRPVYKENGESMEDILLKLMLDCFKIASFPVAKHEVFIYLYYTSAGPQC